MIAPNPLSDALTILIAPPEPMVYRQYRLAEIGQHKTFSCSFLRISGTIEPSYGFSELKRAMIASICLGAIHGIERSFERALTIAKLSVSQKANVPPRRVTSASSMASNRRAAPVTNDATMGLQ